MTDPNFDRHLTAWLDERAQPYAPTGLAADIVERTGRVRPRPAWRVPERWFSMPTTIRLALIPRGLLVLLALWLLLALAVAGAAIGGRLTSLRAVTVPAPLTGPAANGLIAFEHGLDIWVVEPDGSGQRKLLTGPGGFQQPTWSPDGTQIGYLSYAAGGDKGPSEVRVANADGTGAITVGTNPNYVDDVVWSPDGTRIAYASHGWHVTDEAPWDVFVANADGRGATQVASGLVDLDHRNGTPGKGDVAISWSPDGETLLFGATDPARVAPCGSIHCARAFTAAADGSTGAVQIGDPELGVRDPSWSPDGTLIAFAGSDATTVRLYLMDPDGTEVQPFRTSSGGDWSLSDGRWSPSSTAPSAGPNVPTEFLVAADGSGDIMVTRGPKEEIGQSGIFAVDGATGWWVHPDACCIEVPGGASFSPDGQYLLISSGGEDWFVGHRDGTMASTIIHGAELDWQRLAPEGS